MNARLKYIKRTINDKNYDQYFCKIFWQYIRIKNIFYGNVVQSNKIKGLDYFTEYYKKGTDQPNSWNKGLEIAIQNQLSNNNLQKLELRLSIGYGKNVKIIKKSIKKNLIKILEIYQNINKRSTDQKLPLIGFIYHFIKNEDVNGVEKCWSNYKEFNDSCDLKFSKRINEYKMQVDAINQLRTEIPKLSHYIVGIDAASIEHKTEPWVFAPVYQFSRDSLKTKIFSSKSDIIKNLGFTFHVGEDFRHIITGLRHIDEVINHFGYHAGDRIGHGIALGLDVKKWILKNNVVIIPRGEYMDNLLWCWGVYKNGNSFTKLDISAIELKIMKLAKEIYEHIEGITVFSLWQAYQNKFTQFSLKEENSSEIKMWLNKQNDSNEKKQEYFFCKYSSQINTQIWNIEKLSLALHCKKYLEKLKEPIQVEVSKDYYNTINQLQEIVSEKISQEGIVIETNPSSNITIGHFDHILEHYILNLNDRGLNGEYSTSKGLLVSINTDDPAIFNTNLSNEFAYIFYALHNRGYAREDILSWIDKIRDNGIRTSFIESRNISKEEYLKEIEQLIYDLKQ